MKKQHLELSQRSFKVYRTEKFNQQVKYLCKQVPNQEWSGVLFYSVKGEFPDDCEFTLEEILPLDIGSAAFTSYDLDEKLVGFQTENVHTLEMRKGHIHSHNKMATFFSGTDIDELLTNAENHLYYLSIIVNNENDITGKIAINTTTEIRIKNNENEFTVLKEAYQETVISYNCQFDFLVDETFKKSFEGLKTKEKSVKGNFDNGFTFDYVNPHDFQRGHRTFDPNPYVFDAKKMNIKVGTNRFSLPLDKQEFLKYCLSLGKASQSLTALLTKIVAYDEVELTSYIGTLSEFVWENYEDYWIKKGKNRLLQLHNLDLDKANSYIRKKAEDTLCFYQEVFGDIIDFFEEDLKHLPEQVSSELVGIFEGILIAIEETFEIV